MAGFLTTEFQKGFVILLQGEAKIFYFFRKEKCCGGKDKAVDAAGV